jgi:hypothetical protein
VLSVETPGWNGQKGSKRSVNAIAREVIKKHIGPFGIEAIGGLSPFYGDLKREPQFLTHIDFESREGAQQAAKAIHDTEIEGRRTLLEACKLAPWRADRIGKVDKDVLAQLRESGIASQEPYTDKFSGKPKPTKASRKN